MILVLYIGQYFQFFLSHKKERHKETLFTFSFFYGQKEDMY